MSITVQLTRPVIAHGTEINELVLREPSGDDVIQCGYPLQISDGGAVPIPNNIAKLAVKMAGVPLSTIKALNAVDFNAVVGGVLGFFGESTTPTS